MNITKGVKTMAKLTVSRKWYESQNQENKQWFAILAPKNGVQETKQFINLCVKCGVTPRSQVKLQAVDVHGNLYEVNQDTKKLRIVGKI